MAIRRVLRRVPGAHTLARGYYMLKDRARRRLGTAVVPRYYYGNAFKKIRIDRDVPGFSELATRIVADGRTFLDYDRLYTLWQATQALRPGSIAVEIGVYRGGSARFLAEATRSLEGGIELYACDTFVGHPVVDASVDGRHRVGESFADVVLSDVQGYLAPFDNVRIVVGDIRERAADIPDRPIGLLHVDVDVYPATRFSLDHFAQRVDVGGVVIVDDYGFTTCAGAKKAVDEFVAENDSWRFFHLITGQGLLVRAS